jgi:hypothetical protein
MSQDNALDHLEEEINELESVNPWGRAVRWGAGIIIVVALVTWVVWLVASPPPSSSASRMSYVPSGVASIDVSEPRGTTLDEPPARFAWESVTGRFQYIARVYVKGTSEPVVMRATTTAYWDLTPDERAKLARGKTYVWTVVAQGKDGANIGAGQSSFKVR